MLSWPALLLAPLIALSQLSIAYSLVSPSCAQQDRSALHAVAGVALLLVLVTIAMAWRAWRGKVARPGHGTAAATANGRPVTSADGDGASQRPRFIELVAVLVGALSALVSAALWVPIWLLSPCY